MVKGNKRRAVLRVKRRRRTKVRPTPTASRRQTPSSPSSSVGAATSGVDSAKVPHTQLRTMRAERRNLVQQLAETQRRARAAEKERDENERLAETDENERERNLVQQLAETERRAKTAEKERDENERRAETAEKERDELLDEQSALYDKGSELWQNVWHQEDTSHVLTFPTNKSVVCDSYHSGGNNMPGVHARGAIDNGRSTQSIWLKGAGYTLVGLVTSEEEKQALRRHAGADFTKMPLMTSIYSSDGDERKGDVFTIEVDMTERRAKLYVSDMDSSHLLKPHTVWEDLPDKVWVAVAFKRNSGREAVLMPCIHWNIMVT